MTPSRIAIVGAGCAGLSLARALVEESSLRNTEIIVFDRRTEYIRDRTWCFWNCVPHRFENAVAHRWNAWSVADDARTVVCESDTYAYCQIPSDRFYELALGELRKHANVSFRLGVELGPTALTQSGKSVFVNGETPGFDVAYDSRAIGLLPHSLLQHFVGWEIVATRPTFDARVAMLMDFRREAGSPKPSTGTQFMYVLPTTSTHALVESTFFSTRVLDAKVYENEIRDYLRVQYSLDDSDYTISNRERGVLPMDTAHGVTRDDAPSVRRIHRIGVAGGAAKPSSGYAFLAIQRMATQLAKDIPSGRFTPQARVTASLFLDEVFLRFVREQPSRAPAMFTRLFAAAPPDSVARFMSEVASPRETFQIVRAMPKLDFTRSAAATLSQRILGELPR